MGKFSFCAFNHFSLVHNIIENGRVSLIQNLAREGEVAAGDIVRLWSTLDTESWMLDNTQARLGCSYSTDSMTEDDQ